MPLPERDIFHFIDVTLACFNKLTVNEIALRDPTIEFQSLVFSAYTGLIKLSGQAEGFAYLTASQQFLQYLYTARHNRGRFSDENCRDVMSDIANAVANGVRKRLGETLTLSAPRIFSTVPDDPIEMPPAVFVQPLFWRKEYAYLVLGLSSPETA
jgi:hypothetical protein